MAKLLNLTGRDAPAPIDVAAVRLGEEGPVVSVRGDAAYDDLCVALAEVETILIDFPDFKDGRGFTLATKLRAHCSFEGEIRAIGKFLPDQTLFLVRCGFDTALFEDEAAYETGAAALRRFSVPMQAAPACPKPTVLHLRHGRTLSGAKA